MKKTMIWKSLVMGFALAAPAALADDDANKTSLKTKTRSAGRSFNDGMISSKVKAKLATMKGMKSSNIYVDTNDGVVSLGGVVATNELKKEAERAVRSMDNVRSVRNGLVVGTATAAAGARDGDRNVDRSVTGYGDRDGRADRDVDARDGETGNDLDDMRMSAGVKMRLLTASDVPATDINVDVVNKVVYLFGMVPTEATKKAAGNEAQKVDGVARVENQLQVVPSNRVETASAKDEDIQRDINLRMKDRPELKDVETVVEGAMVRVKGKVANQWDQINALRLIRTIPGVKGVQNLLEVDEKDAPKARDERRY